MSRFVPVADAPGPYREAKEKGRADTLEYRLVHGAMNQTGFGGNNGMGSWHVQGLYVITPSGRLIAGSNNVSEPDATLREMRKGLEAYARMPRSERLLARTPDPNTDRMLPRNSAPRAPKDGLVLRAVVRGLSPDGVREGYVLAPSFYKMDRLWYTGDEARRFVPETIEVGATRDITGPVLDGLVQFHLGGFEEGPGYWQPDEIKRKALRTRIVGVSGTLVEVRLTGSIDIDANGQYNKQKYRADLSGRATYDTRARRFRTFELLAMGQHSVSPHGRKEGGPAWIPLGVFLTLNGANPNDSQAPSKLPWYSWVGLKSARM